jgi:hypothetical protein
VVNDIEISAFAGMAILDFGGVQQIEPTTAQGAKYEDSRQINPSTLRQAQYGQAQGRLGGEGRK